ncbi:MAG: TlpA family protein disulfide reductase [Thermoguttaceae bacterium]|nr:TlpA family protein disulfide reductase [Thermoguttaceae bacterium]
MARDARFAIGLSLAILLVSAVGTAEEPVRPDFPTTLDKSSLVSYQEALTQWSNAVCKTEKEFWSATGDDFYRSTKALLDLDDLTAQERAEYDAQLSGILGNFALSEAENGGFGPKFEELRARTAEALQKNKLDPSDESRDLLLGRATRLFDVRLSAALGKSEEAREAEFVALVGDAITFALSVPEFGETANNIVATIRVHSPDLGEEALDAMCEAFEASENPALVKPIQETLGKRRFARLVGNELYFEAKQFDGKDFGKTFEWGDFEGKVVLVEIWATWCGPCRREIPRLKEAYARYRDAGFEVVGYSIDQDVEFLKKFVADNEIPWTTTSQKRSVEAGYKGLYEYYSINGVPEMILVGRDGKVIETDCRGCKLAERLKELFPNVEPLGWDPANDFSQRVSSPEK